MPHLTLAGSVPFLLRLGLIGPDSITGSELTIEDASSRNLNRKVSRRRGRNYLLKQAVKDASDVAILREALVYRFLSKAPQIVGYLPRFYGYDTADQVLVLEHIRGVRDLAQRMANGRWPFTAVARRIGACLAALHTLNARSLPGELGYLTEPPWVLAIHRPPVQTLREVSGANLELIREIQATRALCDLLDALRSEWKCTALIHMDLRSSNWLVSDPGAPPCIKLVDWETACLGDPCWDVGSMLAEYVIWWALQVPIAGEPQRDETSGVALERTHRAIAAFWLSYARLSRLELSKRNGFLLLSLRYAAARLIQSAYERLRQSWKLDGFAVRLLQLSLNILQQPEAAARHLSGISPATSRRTARKR